jgi:hypothetical protein
MLLLGAPPAAATPSAEVPVTESRTIVGEIVWVDVPARLVLIRESVKTTRVKGQPPARQTVAVSIAPDVAVTRGRTAVNLENLKAKDHVTARYVTTPEGAKALTFRVAETLRAAPAAASAAGDGSSSAGN